LGATGAALSHRKSLDLTFSQMLRNGEGAEKKTNRVEGTKCNNLIRYQELVSLSPHKIESRVEPKEKPRTIWRVDD